MTRTIVIETVHCLHTYLRIMSKNSVWNVNKSNAIQILLIEIVIAFYLKNASARTMARNKVETQYDVLYSCAAQQGFQLCAQCTSVYDALFIILTYFATRRNIIQLVQQQTHFKIIIIILF